MKLSQIPTCTLGAKFNTTFCHLSCQSLSVQLRLCHPLILSQSHHLSPFLGSPCLQSTLHPAACLTFLDCISSCSKAFHSSSLPDKLLIPQLCFQVLPSLGLAQLFSFRSLTISPVFFLSLFFDTPWALHSWVFSKLFLLLRMSSFTHL